MSINYSKCSTNVRYTYDNLQDAIKDFSNNSTKENKEEVLERISDMQKSLSTLKCVVKNIYLGGNEWTEKIWRATDIIKNGLKEE